MACNLREEEVSQYMYQPTASACIGDWVVQKKGRRGKKKSARAAEQELKQDLRVAAETEAAAKAEQERMEAEAAAAAVATKAEQERVEAEAEVAKAEEERLKAEAAAAKERKEAESKAEEESVKAVAAAKAEEAEAEAKAMWQDDWHDLLQDLIDMGFEDEDANRTAIATNQGKLSQAIKLLVAQERSNHNHA